MLLGISFIGLVGFLMPGLLASRASEVDAPRVSYVSPADTLEAVRVIDELWAAFDARYALFEDKRVPWSRIRGPYLERAADVTSASELFDLGAEMLALLNDNHVKLTGWTSVMSTGGSLRGVGGATPDFSRELVRGSYLVSPAEERAGGLVSFGWLPDSVGYVHVTNEYDLEASTKAFEEALAEFGDARGLVLDLRRNLGGQHTVGAALASRLADQPRRYMTTRLKRGPARDDFTAPKDWILSPPPEGGFTRPVAVLVHDRTFSAGEAFVLALRVLPHVVVVGTRTSGSMGETENEALSNGWVYRTVVQRIVDPLGRSWEGVGIPPDLRVVNAPEEIEAGRDRALEVAMALAGRDTREAAGGAGGGPSSRAEPADPRLDAASRSFRLPLADSLAAWIAEAGMDAAMRRFEAARADTVRWSLAEDWEYGDLTALGRDLLEAGRTDEAARVLEAAAEAYPDSYRPHRWLVRVYGELDRPAAAEEARRRALDLNPELFSTDRR
ncbi:MAG: S41 family peptidase, partial [Gemmatimonadota bacterium]